MTVIYSIMMNQLILGFLLKAVGTLAVMWWIRRYCADTARTNFISK